MNNLNIVAEHNVFNGTSYSDYQSESWCNAIHGTQNPLYLDNNLNGSISRYQRQ